MVMCKVKKDFYYDTMSQLGELRQNGLLCDVTLTVGQDTLAANRCVLATGSQYFRSLFLGQFKEASMHNVNMSDVTDDVKDLELVVNFMYSGEIDIDDSNLGVLVQLSSFLLIDPLRKFCANYMMKNLCLKNCLRYYLYAHMHDQTSVEKKASKMVGSRFHDYIMFDNSLDLSPDEVLYLMDDGLFAHFSALKMVNFVSVWLKNEVTEEHISVANQLLDKVAIKTVEPVADEIGTVEPVICCGAAIEPVVTEACGKEILEPVIGGGETIETVVTEACGKEILEPVNGGGTAIEIVIPVTDGTETMVRVTDGIETVVPVTDGIETVVPVNDGTETVVPVNDGTETVVPVTNGGAVEQQKLAKMAEALQGQTGAGARGLLEKAQAIYAEMDSKQGPSFAKNKTFMDEEEVVVTLSPKQCLMDVYDKHLSKVHLKEPVFDLCCYVPRTKVWYHIRDLKPWETGLFTQRGDGDDGQGYRYLYQLCVDNIGTIMYKEELVIMDDDSLKGSAKIHFYNIRNKSYRLVETTDFETTYSEDIWLEGNEMLQDYSRYSYCCVTDDHSLYLLYKVNIGDDENDVLGEYFRCLRLKEDCRSLETVFRSDIARNMPCAGGILQAKISSVSNEMIFTCSPHYVFVVDLNNEHPVPVNVFTMVTEESDRVLTGVKITQTSTHFYIVQDGTMDGNVQIMFEYEFNSQRLTKPIKDRMKINHLGKGIYTDPFPYMDELVESSNKSIWLFEGNHTLASFLAEFEPKSDGSIAYMVHTPPPFVFMTAMFIGKLPADLLEEATPIERFLLSGRKLHC